MANDFYHDRKAKELIWVKKEGFDVEAGTRGQLVHCSLLFMGAPLSPVLIESDLSLLEPDQT